MGNALWTLSVLRQFDSKTDYDDIEHDAELSKISQSKRADARLHQANSYNSDF
jgi:hypothetical protein